MLTSVFERWSSICQRPGPGPLPPQGNHPAQVGRFGQRRQHLPTEQGQVVLGEGAVSFQGRQAAVCPPQLCVVWGVLLLEQEVSGRGLETREDDEAHVK